MARKSGGLFARLALDYADHPKIASLSDGAFRLHVEMILYARRYETDGLIKNPVALRLASRWDSDVLAELENNDPDCPSVIQLENGDYMIHGYADMQETREEIRARRRKNRENGARGGRPKKTQSVSDSDSESQTESGTQKKAETETETDIRTSSEIADAIPDGDPNDRQDIQQLLDYLDQQLEADGVKTPSRTKKNQDAARLMLDRDGRTPEQVRAAIEYSRHSEFWRTNILSMSKLREKFDTLRLQAQKDGYRPGAPVSRPSQAAHPTAANPGAFTNWDENDYRPWHTRPHVVEAQERVDAAREAGEQPSDDDLATIAGPPGAAADPS